MHYISKRSHGRRTHIPAKWIGHHLHLYFREDLLLLWENLEAHWHDIHKSDAGAEPEDFSHEWIHNKEELIGLVDELIELIFAVIFDQLRDLGFLLLLLLTIMKFELKDGLTYGGGMWA